MSQKNYYSEHTTARFPGHFITTSVGAITTAPHKGTVKVMVIGAYSIIVCFVSLSYPGPANVARKRWNFSVTSSRPSEP